jgi:hypothetical protein
VATTYHYRVTRSLFIAAAMVTAMGGAAVAMSVTDFLLDADDLKGQTVSVSGLAVCMGVYRSNRTPSILMREQTS